MENVKKPALKDKVTDVVSTAKEYWHKPAEGKYVSYKEVAFLSGAGFGAHWLTLLASGISLSATNYIVGPSLGLEPMHLQIMLNVANLVGIPIGIFRAWYYDNHHLKGGKFLPFIQKSALPIFLLSTLFVWLPYESMDYITKAVVVEIMYLAMAVALSFYNECYTYFQQIVTPDSQERANVMSISQVIYSLAPTITNAALPALAGMTWGRDNIWTYRVIYPCFTVIGLIMSLVFFRKVKERLILPKTKPEPVRMLDAIREVAKNKYYWMIQAAAWVVFLESGYGVILTWSFNYGFDGKYAGAPEGIASLVIGNAALWSMLACPFAIKAMGKRNLLILMNSINVLVILGFYFVYKNILLICILTYFNTFINTFWNITQHGISADMRDYHQWKTGVRVDGAFGTMAIIGTFISFFTGLVVPAIYEANGVKDDKTVLYDDSLRNNLFEILIVLSIVGAILNLIPYLFYDLTEAKQRGYVSVIKIRVMMQNFGDKVLSREQLIDGVETMRWARSVKEDEAQLKAKTGLSRAERKRRNDDIVTATIITDELDKFSTKMCQVQLETARRTVVQGPLCIYQDEMSEAKALPKSTAQEKEIRKDAIELARKKREAAKIIAKVGRENLKEPDEKVLEEIKQRQVSTLSENIALRRDLKKYQKSASLYHRAMAPYLNAVELIQQAENYSCMAEIEKLYEKEISLADNV